MDLSSPDDPDDQRLEKDDLDVLAAAGIDIPICQNGRLPLPPGGFETETQVQRTCEAAPSFTRPSTLVAGTPTNQTENDRTTEHEEP